jgi:GNAT superfamily N-acetyltransferase
MTIPDGYTDLAPGKLTSVVTYLEMRERPAQLKPSPSTVHLRRIQKDWSDPKELDWYRTIYRRAGEQWLWFSRLEISDARLTEIMARPTTELFVAESVSQEKPGLEIGLAELDRSHPPDVEITDFALFSEFIGKGLGRNFMNELLSRAWSPSTKRVWLHTCNLDGPAALAFYIKCGFHPYKQAIEVANDPRLTGALPKDAAPNVPIIK